MIDKDFPKEFYQQFDDVMKLAKKQVPQLVAAFDADGTLWNTDLGENFFQYKIQHNLIPLPPDPWTHYNQLKEKNGNPSEAYLWLAQIMKGLPEATMRKWAREAVESLYPLPIFKAQKDLIGELKSAGVHVFIVTASVKWAVEPAAQALGLSPENVIGIETQIGNGQITEIQKGIITYRQGKVDALLKETKGIRPFFASGNSSGDIELLDSATHFRLCMSAAPKGSELYEKEMELFRHGQSRQWWTHRMDVSNEHK
jgi:HAD superfamily phosphoserine phosphatase-like hydrolase